MSKDVQPWSYWGCKKIEMAFSYTSRHAIFKWKNHDGKVVGYTRRISYRHSDRSAHEASFWCDDIRAKNMAYLADQKKKQDALDAKPVNKMPI